MKPSRKNKPKNPQKVKNTCSTTNSCTIYILLLSVMVVSFSFVVLLINFFHFQYPGNNYFPPDAAFVALTLLIIYSGFAIQMGANHQITKIFKEIIVFFMMVSILAMLTNAVQYTPFSPIDDHILWLEQSLHIDLTAMMAWANHSPIINNGMTLLYDSLPLQMTYIPLLIILTNQKQKIREFYFLMLCSAAIGFAFYYFFPTTAPASVLESPFFSESQKATALKFFQIHQHIKPTTLEGGLIAFPSFHVIWAWLCLYLLRGWPILYVPMGLLNLALIASCVLLGWHYPMDILGGLLVIGIAHSLYYIFVKKRQINTVIDYPISTPTGVYNFC